MLFRAHLRQLAVAALQNAGTDAADRVYSPRDWPTFSGTYPAILVQTPRERKESNFRGLPNFTTVATVSVVGRVEAGTAEDAEAALETLSEQIENAVLTDFDLVSSIQQFASVDTRMEVTAEGRKHLGEVQMDFGIEFFQAYDPIQLSPHQPVAVPLESVGIHADLVQPFDANGTYLNAQFPNAVNPAPRTSGPDGRDEGALDIQLPQ